MCVGFPGFWERRGKLRCVEFPDSAKYYLGMSALELQLPQRGILVGTLEARQAGFPLNELKTGAVKMPDASVFSRMHHQTY